MLDRFIRPLRESFSAKIIALVSMSVLVTSVVVGLVTIRSTQRFLTEKTSEKFPSVLNTSKSKVKIFYERQHNDLVRLSQSTVFKENLEAFLHGVTVGAFDTTAAAELNKYLAIVHNKFPVYDDLMLMTTDGTVVAATGSTPGFDTDDIKDIVDIFQESGSISCVSPAVMQPDGSSVVQSLIVPVRDGDSESTGVLMVAKLLWLQP